MSTYTFKAFHGYFNLHMIFFSRFTLAFPPKHTHTHTLLETCLRP